MNRRRRILAVAIVILIAVAAGGYAVARFAVMRVDSSLGLTSGTGRIVVVDRFAYLHESPHRGDIVVYTGLIPFAPPLAHSVVAVPGDSFAIRDGRLISNGTYLAKTYGGRGYKLEISEYGIVVNGKRLGESDAIPSSEWASPSTVPPGCYIVLGYSPRRSLDSHSTGFLCPGRTGFMSGGDATRLLGRALAQ